MSISDFGTFFSLILRNIADFLMLDPIIYFVGLILLGFIVIIVHKILFVSH